MKTAMALINTCAALALVSTIDLMAVDARPMHAGINYARYLQEADAIASELDDWMSKFEDDAEANGWLPQTESRSADEIYEDRKQRFFMAKELVNKLQEENPEAKFTTDSPFTLLTEDEFSTYVQNSYLAGEAEGRKLRHNRPEYANEGNANQGQGNGRAKSYDFQSMFRKFFEDAWKNSNEANQGGETANEAGAPSSSGGSYSFQDLIDWFNNKYGPGGNGNQPSRQPSNRPRPVPVNPPPASVPTYAPPSRRPTNAPPASIPTGAPVPRPTPTSRPSSNPLPVAPTSAPRPNPVGPVAPSEAPGGAPAPAPTGESASDGNGGINWGKHKCMAPVQNQGQCGSCWAFATVSSTETGKCIASGGALTKLSEQNVASCDRRNSGCNGGALVYAMEYIKTNNVCTAASDPYTSGNGRLAACNSGCQKVQLGLKSTTRISGENGLINALNKAPVTIAVAAGNNAWKQYAGGVLSTCQTTRVDHAVVAVGYDASSVIIRNSWGARWGEAGYIRMKLGAGGSGTCSMYSDMSQPVF